MRGLSRLPAVLAAAGSRYLAAGCTQHAAGIAYRVLFSLAPLAIVLVSVFGLVLQDAELRERVVNEIVDALPVDGSGSADVQNAIEDIATPASAAGLVGLLVLLWAASGMMAAIRQGLERATGVVEGRPAAQNKLVDLALVGLAALLVLVSVGVGLVSQFVDGLVEKLAAALGLEGGAIEAYVSLLLPFLVWVATALLVYRFVPGARLRSSGAFVGAVVTALLLLAISLAADLAYEHVADWSVVYGSLTSLLVFLYSVYLYASALLFGAAVAVEWSRPPAPGSDEPLGTRLRKGARGIFVRPRDTHEPG